MTDRNLMHPTGTVTLLFSDIEGSTRLLRAIGAELLERYLGRARLDLGEVAANAAWEEGRRTGFEYAITLALNAETSQAPLDQSRRATP